MNICFGSAETVENWKLKVESCFILHFPFSIFNFPLQAFGLLVGPSGLEPPTSCLSGTRSNLLSYDPMWLVWFSHLVWWRWWDSNPWPPACRAGALPAELHPHLSEEWRVKSEEVFLSSFFSFLSLGFAFSPFFSHRSGFLHSLTVSALSYFPVQSPVKYFHHCRA